MGRGTEEGQPKEEEAVNQARENGMKNNNRTNKKTEKLATNENSTKQKRDREREWERMVKGDEPERTEGSVLGRGGARIRLKIVLSFLFCFTYYFRLLYEYTHSAVHLPKR